jgi:7-carboxy-7-deazaguanine synthase
MARDEGLQVSELFYSLQGESTFAGLPCVFIRLAGCNLRCSYCDAAYTYNETGEEQTLAAILAYADSYPTALVELTGGEPLLQENSLRLMHELLRRRRTVLLETNGSRPIAALPPEIHVILDVKCPASGMADSWLPENLEAIRSRQAVRADCTEIKFVISDLEDYHFARDFVRQHGFAEIAPVLFSPVRGRMSSRILAERILTDRLPVRLQLQLHTLIWPEISRGI